MAVSLVGGACSSNSVLSNTNNFSRASDVAFVCVNVPDGAGLPLSECGLNASDNSPTGDPNHHLHALVTQSERGEVAVVDLAATSGVALVDNSPGVPGFNFLPVSPSPTALVVDVRGAGPSQVWVASATRNHIQRVDVRALRRDPRAAQADLPTVAPLALPGAPTDLALDTLSDGRVVLYAALPDRGTVVTVDVTDPTAPRLQETRALSAGAGDAGLGDGGAADAGRGAARPVALAVDGRSHRLYVADEASTLVHVIEGGGATLRSPIDLGFRTRSLALSGWVRARASCTDAAADADHCARARYLYAVAAEDGALYAWDLVRGARVRANLLPQPNARSRRLNPAFDENRVALPAPATAVTALNTSDYVETADPNDPEGVVIQANAPCETGPCAGAVTPAPSALRGVFMAVTLRNGDITFVDLDDYDAACREASCSSGQAAYRFVRHAPRALATLTDPPRLTAQPAVTGIIRGTERTPITDTASIPSFACTASRAYNAPTGCSTANNFGVELTRREDLAQSASVPDPYIARNESWGFTYEGVLPGLDQAGGALSVDGSALRLDLPGAAFCTRGTLATAAARDLVVLVSDPVPQAGDAELCRGVFGSGASASNRDFEIDRAYEDRLVLRGSQDATPELVARCFPQATRFQVRAGGQWLVLGSRAGFVHGVRANASTRECELDPARQAETERLAGGCLVDRVPVAMRAPLCPTGRACTGSLNDEGTALATLAPVFANPYFCTQLFPAVRRGTDGRFSAVPTARETQMTLAVTGAYEPYATDVGNFPVNVRWVPAISRLYVVDTQNAGLLEFRLSPLTRGRQFN